jgi:hypothetical protein
MPELLIVANRSAAGFPKVIGVLADTVFKHLGHVPAPLENDRRLVAHQSDVTSSPTTLGPIPIFVPDPRLG